MISLQNVSFSYSNKQNKIKDITLEINAGEFFTILGASGCGKSTILKLMAGIENPSLGKIENQSRFSQGFVFQEATLLPWLNVFENIYLPNKISGQNHLKTTNSNSTDKIHQLLRLLKIENTDKLYPSELSGGMKMRVAIARALFADPKVIFLDEPFSALDEVTREQLQFELFNIHKQNQRTSILVTHSLSEAAFLSDRIAFMNRRGEIQKIISSPFSNSQNVSNIRDSQLRYDSNFLEFSKNLKRIWQDVCEK
jgi:NitT/TauT family transport system ATP-binding protein